MKEFLIFALLLWQLDPTSSLNEKEFPSSSESTVRNRRKSSVDCKKLTSTYSTKDILKTNCAAIASTTSFTLKMDDQINMTLWEAFTANMKQSKGVNFHFINTDAREIALNLDGEFISKELIITGNNFLESIMIINPMSSIQLDKLIITGNRLLSEISIVPLNFIGKIVKISENSALNWIDLNMTTMIIGEELVIEKNPQLKTIQTPNPNIFEQTKKMKIRGNHQLGRETIRQLKLARWSQLDEDSEIQDVGECAFIKEITSIHQLIGCNTVFGDLIIAHNITGKQRSLRLNHVTGNVHLNAPPLDKQGHDHEGLYDFLRRTQIDGKLTTDRCDMPVLQFDLWNNRPIEKNSSVNCAKLQKTEKDKKETGDSLVSSIVFGIAVLLILTGLGSFIVLTIFMVGIKRRILDKKEDHRPRHFTPPNIEKYKAMKKKKPQDKKNK